MHQATVHQALHFDDGVIEGTVGLQDHVAEQVRWCFSAELFLHSRSPCWVEGRSEANSGRVVSLKTLALATWEWGLMSLRRRFKPTQQTCKSPLKSQELSSGGPSGPSCFPSPNVNKQLVPTVRVSVSFAQRFTFRPDPSPGGKTWLRLSQCRNRSEPRLHRIDGDDLRPVLLPLVR